jgi:ADP-heptose:LPS heptosyltransferase
MIAAASIWCPRPRTVAVFRALNLGDLLCSMPAFRALRRALPQAWISLVGLDSARPIVERFGRYIDELLPFPGDAAFPEQEVRHSEAPAFYRNLQERRFDLALQLHGSGWRANDIVGAFGARRWAGFAPRLQDQVEGRLMLWPDRLHEIRRYLSLLQWLGLTRVGGLPELHDVTLEFPLTQADRAEAEAAARWAGIVPARTIFIHPGARLPSRRWPSERFAEVARIMSARGWGLALTGGPDERELTSNTAAQAGVPIANLCGLTSLGALAALLARGRLLICNDTGISHIAAAVGLPSVVIASGSDVRRWAPLDAARHVVLHQDMPCRPCAHYECPIGHPCALAVSVEQVIAQAAVQLTVRLRGPHSLATEAAS